MNKKDRESKGWRLNHNLHDIDQTKIYENLELLEPDKFVLYDIPFCRGITRFDRYILTQFLDYINAVSVTELGCGCTTEWMRQHDLDVQAFSIGIPPVSKVEEEFVECDLLTDDGIEIALQSAIESDVIVIDCLHTWNMAERFCEGILNKAKKPVYIHDWFMHSDTVYGEQIYIWNNLINKTYKLFTYTDLPRKKLNSYGVPVEYRQYECAAVLMPIGEEDG